MKKYLFDYFRKNGRNIIDKHYIYRCLLSYEMILYSGCIFIFSAVLFVLFLIFQILSLEILSFFMFVISLITLVISYCTASPNYYIYEDELVSKDINGNKLIFKNYPITFSVSKFIFDDVNVGERLCIIIGMSKNPYNVIKKNDIPYGDDIKESIINNLDELDVKVKEFYEENGMNDSTYKNLEGENVTKLEAVGKENFDLEKFKSLFLNQYKYIGRNNIVALLFVISMIVILMFKSNQFQSTNPALSFFFCFFFALGLAVGANAFYNLKKYYDLLNAFKSGRIYYKEEKVIELANYSNYYTTSNYPIKVKTEGHDDFFIASQHYVYDLSVGDLVYTFYLDDKYYFMLSAKHYDLFSYFRKR